MDQDRDRPGLQTIGSLIQSIVDMQQPVDGTTAASASKPTLSPTGAGGKGRPTATGMPPGGPGSARPTNTLPATLPERMVLTASRDPARLLPQCMQSCLAAAVWDDERTSHGWDGYVARYELVQAMPEAERQ